MQPLNMIGNLKEISSKNAQMNAILHLFAMRERGRRHITVSATLDSLKGEGFNYTRGDVEGVFTMLADAGLGKLLYSAKGQLMALTDIEIAVQTLAKAILGDETKVKATRKRLQKVNWKAVSKAVVKVKTEQATKTAVPTGTIFVQGVEYRVKLEPVAQKKVGNA